MWPFSKKKAPASKKKLVAAMPRGKVLRHFVARQDFDAPETKSTYCKGMKYSVREGNEALIQHVDNWVEEGKAQWL